MAKLQLMVPNQCPRDDIAKKKGADGKCGGFAPGSRAQKIRQVF